MEKYKTTENLKLDKVVTIDPDCNANDRKFNTLSDKEIFDNLFDHYVNNKFDNFEEDLLKVREYFCKEGGLPFYFMKAEKVFEKLLIIMLNIKTKIPNLFNLSLEIINQIIAHSDETVDYLEVNDFTIFDQINEVLEPFINENVINYNQFIPEMFNKPAYNNVTIDITINMVTNLCRSKPNILYKNKVLYSLSNILRMKVNDNRIRDRQIVDCLGSILLKSSEKLLSKISYCNIVFQGYRSVFENFNDQQNCIIVISDICQNLLRLLREESSMVILFYQNEFYQLILPVLDFIFANNVDLNYIVNILEFIIESISSDQKYCDGKDNYDFDSAINGIADMIGRENYVSNFYSYILNVTVERIHNSQYKPENLFSADEGLIMSHLFDLLEQLIMIKDSTIIEYKNIEEVFLIIDQNGKTELKISMNNFIIGLIQNLPIDQLHRFLNLNFMPELFESFIDFEETNPIFIISAIEFILNKIGITNDHILAASSSKNNDAEINLILQTFPEVLQSFLNSDTTNRVFASSVLNTYFQGL